MQIHTDVIARPRPLVVAGEVKSFGFDFAARTFEMTFIPDSAKGESEIFVPIDRHFPGLPHFLRRHGPGLRSRRAHGFSDRQRSRSETRRRLSLGCKDHGRVVVGDWRCRGEPKMKILRITQ